MYKRKKYNFYILIVFLILLAGIYALVSFNHSKTKAINLSRYSETLGDEYNIIVGLYSDMADIILNTIVKTDNILTPLELAYSTNSPEEKDQYRNQIQNSLTKIYDDLQLSGVRQLHFHDRNNLSFLRMRKPDKFGDDLTGIRASVESVNRERRPVSGFEEGRIFNGYRNVYPLESLSAKTWVQLKSVFHSKRLLINWSRYSKKNPSSSY